MLQLCQWVTSSHSQCRWITGSILMHLNTKGAQIGFPTFVRPNCAISKPLQLFLAPKDWLLSCSEVPFSSSQNALWCMKEVSIGYLQRMKKWRGNTECLVWLCTDREGQWQTWGARGAHASGAVLGEGGSDTCPLPHWVSVQRCSGKQLPQQKLHPGATPHGSEGLMGLITYYKVQGLVHIFMIHVA